MHWTRIAIGASALLALLGTCLPWLVNVPPDELTIGSGTIYGITTPQGIIAGVAGITVLVLTVVLGPRTIRPHRGALGGFLGASIIAVAVASFVFGTSQSSMLDDREADVLESTGSQHQANLAVIALGKKFDEHDMDTGNGSLPFAGGWALIFLLSGISMILRRGAKPPPKHAAAGPPPGMVYGQ